VALCQKKSLRRQHPQISTSRSGPKHTQIADSNRFASACAASHVALLPRRRPRRRSGQGPVLCSSLVEPLCWWKSGPKGGRRHNSPLSSLPPFACFRKATTSTCARRGDAKTQPNSKGKEEILNRPKTERPADAFGALFSLQCVRFITRGSLFIGDPWV
jgi:hypothetical protein